jgi:hypothetical protein
VPAASKGRSVRSEQTANISVIIADLSEVRCRVSYVDSIRAEHPVEVSAESLYEASALAVKRFREGPFDGEPPVSGTELLISVAPPPVEHKIQLRRIEEWAQIGATRSPRDVIKRDRVRELLGLSTSR